jgi:hypothetical protein
MQRRAVEFKSTFPNEWTFNESGSPVAPGARELAEVIVSGLRSRPSSITPVEQHEYYGWAFATVFDRSRFYNVLNPVDADCCLTVSMDWYILKSLLLMRPRDSFDQYCGIISETLQQIPEVSEVKWEPYLW